MKRDEQRNVAKGYADRREDDAAPPTASEEGDAAAARREAGAAGPPPARGRRQTLCISSWCMIFGPGLAIRGPDGSMSRAVEGMYAERKWALRFFWAGLIFIMLSGVAAVLMPLNAEGADRAASQLGARRGRPSSGSSERARARSFSDVTGVPSPPLLLPG